MPAVDPRRARREIVTDALAIGVATGAYGISFGALAVTNGFTWPEAQTLSLLMFTGASQFALVAIIGAGGGALTAVTTAWLLGSRNGLYALSLASQLRPHAWRRPVAAQLTIDESTGMAMARDDPDHEWALGFAFWATGISVFVLWNLGTLLGALGAGVVGDPRSLGLDAAASAAFLALLWPRLHNREARAVAVAAGAVALVLTPVTAPGIPVVASAGVAVIAGLWASSAKQAPPGAGQ